MKRIAPYILALVVIFGIAGAFPQTTYATTCKNDGSVTFTVSGSNCIASITATGAGTFIAPSDWTSTNKIQVIGGGGGGAGGNKGGTGTGTTGGGRGGAGGGGGGYSIISNTAAVTAGNSYSFSVGIAGTAGNITGTAPGTGGDTWFCNTTSGCATIGGANVIVGAKGGTGATATTTAGVGGQQSGNTGGVGDTKNLGGSGNTSGTINSSSSSRGGSGGGGGGGAAGGTGAGATASAGTNTSNNTTGTAGGAGGRADSTGATAGTAGSSNGGTGGVGQNGTEFDASHGSGSGAGGGGGKTGSSSGGAITTAGPGNNGGNYGGGGSGGGGGGASSAGGGNGGAGGAGIQGILFITYTPAVAPTVTSNAADTVTVTSANINGNITATGGQNATVRGFATSTNSSLSSSVSTSTFTGSFGTGAFAETFSNTTLTGNTTYYFRAYATNPQGTSYGSILNLLTLPDALVSPTYSSVTPTSLTASWLAPVGGAATYNLEQCITSTNTCSETTSISGTSQAVSSLTANTSYDFAVQGVNATGNGLWSATSTQATSTAAPPRTMRLFEGFKIRLIGNRFILEGQ